jgi:hypothetical protein
MTTLPIASVADAATSPVIVPHYAAGGGWTTEVILVNPTDAAISGTLNFQNVVTYTIPPRTSRTFTSVDTPSASTGPVIVTPSVGATPVTLAIFSLRKGGVTSASAGVPEVKVSHAFEIFDENGGSFHTAQAGSIGTGIAIVNPSESAMTIHVEQYMLDGLPTGRSGILTLPARGHVALFTHEIPRESLNVDTWITGGIEGRIRLWTDSGPGFAAVGLRARYNERGDFLITSTPAIPDDAALNSGPAIFPHFVQGGGYTTEFVLLNRTTGPIASGRLQFFSQSGEPASVPLH